MNPIGAAPAKVHEFPAGDRTAEGMNVLFRFRRQVHEERSSLTVRERAEVRRNEARRRVENFGFPRADDLRDLRTETMTLVGDVRHQQNENRQPFDR